MATMLPSVVISIRSGDCSPPKLEFPQALPTAIFAVHGVRIELCNDRQKRLPITASIPL